MVPVFILGAGFTAEARGLAGEIRGHSIYVGEYEIECGYPLVADLPPICFPETEVASDVVESRLAESIADGDWEPVKRLCSALQKADHYIAPALLTDSAPGNAYRTFFQRFSDSPFINFNYDSFVEFALLRVGSWSPLGGFGVDVGFEVGFTASEFEPPRSETVVLHPHGSLLVYTSDFTVGPSDGSGFRWLSLKDPADFMFDPHAVGDLFYPYGRVVGGFGYSPALTDRVIAPVPEKSDHLTGQFVTEVMRQACDRLKGTDTAVSIGYAFAEYDEASYKGLLDALSEGNGSRLLVISPDAEAIVARLESKGIEIALEPQAGRFSDWVSRGYPGLSEGDI